DWLGLKEADLHERRDDHRPARRAQGPAQRSPARRRPRAQIFSRAVMTRWRLRGWWRRRLLGQRHGGAANRGGDGVLICMPPEKYPACIAQTIVLIWAVLDHPSGRACSPACAAAGKGFRRADHAFEFVQRASTSTTDFPADCPDSMI